MGQLRDRMEQDLKLKGVSPATIRNYLLYCRKFAAFFMRSPEQLGAAEVRAFLLHQIEVEQLAYASYRQVYAARKFLYSKLSPLRGPPSARNGGWAYSIAWRCESWLDGTLVLRFLANLPAI